MMHGSPEAIKLGLKVTIESAYIGKNEKEITDNAKTLGRFQVGYETSINVFQKKIMS
jgi:hypothetical protein